MVEGAQDLRISGAGSANGGNFNEVAISGAGEINGDITCNKLRSSGASDIKGNVKVEGEVKISGASDIGGSLEAETIVMSGGSDVKGDVICKSIEISGGADIKGNLHADSVKISGGVDVGGNCEAEEFEAKGAFEINGLLNAGNINISVGGRCRVKEIGGEKIEVRKSPFNEGIIGKLIKYVFNQDKKLIVDVIEGDDLYLEAVEANVVRGNNITIGDDSAIGVVEYRNTIKVEGNAQVKEQKNI